MSDATHNTNRMFAGFDRTKHVNNNNRVAQDVDSFRLSLAHAYGEHRQISLLSGVIREQHGINQRIKIHVFREFKSGPGMMGPPEIARGIADMIESLSQSTAIDSRVIVHKLKAYGDNNAEGLGTLGWYNRKIEKSLASIGYEISINTSTNVVGARPECEALINALLLTNGLTVNSQCELVVHALQHHQCGAQSPVVNSMRYGWYDILTEHESPSYRIMRG